MKPATATWIRRVLEARGIKIIQWNDGSLGLLNVPSKYCALISDLSAGLAALDRGEPLPEIIEKQKRGKSPSAPPREHGDEA